jgi:hypothetical protein
MECTLESVKIANIAQKPAKAWITLELNAHMLLLEFVAREDGDSAGLGFF